MSVTRIEHSDDCTGRVVDALKRDGCVIVENAIDKRMLANLELQIEKYLETIQGDVENPFNGSSTQRFGRLMHRIKAARKLVMHPTIVDVLDRTLLDWSPAYKLSFDGVMCVNKGQKAQVLHRDNVPFANTPTSPPLLVATLWAIDDFKADNGGTVCAPGSHVWYDDTAPYPEDLDVVEMPRGSVFIYYGNLIHGAGANSTSRRLAVSLQYSVSWLASEENQALSVPIEWLRTFDEPLLRMLGINTIARNYGSVDGKHPIDFVKGNVTSRSLDDGMNSFTNGRCRSLELTVGKPYVSTGHWNVSMDDE